ncbi:MAG: MATE family efflux transporter, partial [Leptospiraceae bacterium]|nr:MATE family efflux transporter [Leptospiraceae bacterium]
MRASLDRKVISLAVPVMIAMISQSAVMIADTAMVGPLGPTSLGAAGLGGVTTWTFIAFLAGLSTGVQILTAHRMGEHDISRLQRILAASVLLSLATGAVVAFAGYSVAHPVSTLLAAEAELRYLTGEYIAYRMAGVIFLFPSFMLRGFFDGLGLTIAGMFSAFLATICNIFLNWVLIYGNLGAPAMGVAGAALASSLSAIPALLIFLPFFYHPRVRPLIRLRLPTFDQYRNIVRTGFAPGVEQALTNLSFVAFTRLSALAGTAVLAANNVVFIIIAVSFMPGFSFGIAATTILGQAMGKEQLELARLGVWTAARIAATIMAFFAIAFLLFAETIIGWFTPDTEVIREASNGLRIAALVQVADAYHMVRAAALRGAGLFWWVLRIYLAV